VRDFVRKSRAATALAADNSATGADEARAELACDACRSEPLGNVADDGTPLAGFLGEMPTATTRRVLRSVTSRSTRPGRRTSTTKLRAVKHTPTALLPIGPPSSSAPLPDRYLLTVLRGDPLGRVIRAGVEDVIIGRGGSANFVLADPGLSWIHARVFREGDALYIEDLGSTNGTFVGHNRVTRPTRIQPGDRIRVGGHTILKLSTGDQLEEESARRLYESTVRDSLTSVHNRRYFEERLAAELSFAERHGDTLALFLVDVDHFKCVNDNHGHHVGDGVLRVVANAIQRILRPEDILARYGGDEFVILARHINRDNAAILAERIRGHVAALDFPFGKDPTVTVSIGLTILAPRAKRCDAAAAVADADAAMYEAKHRGRNCVVVG
jgi:two-component system cell cycle response regulator